jgi:hypothetical protein
MKQFEKLLDEALIEDDSPQSLKSDSPSIADILMRSITPSENMVDDSEEQSIGHVRETDEVDMLLKQASKDMLDDYDPVRYDSKLLYLYL